MNEKKALFIALNATGHINALMGIADRLKDDHKFHTIFLLPSPTNLTSIEKHGHELRILNKNEATSNSNPTDKYSSETEMNQALDNMHEALSKLDPVDAWVDINTNGTGFRNIRDKYVDDHESFKLAINSINPDIIILDTWYIFPCILKMRHIPWVYICSGNPLTFTISKLPDGIRVPIYSGTKLFKNKAERQKLQKTNPKKWQEMLERWKIDSERLSKALPLRKERFGEHYIESGFEPLEPGVKGHCSPFLNLYQFPKEIDYDLEDDLFEYPPRWIRCDTFMRKSIDQIDPKEAIEWSQRLQLAREGKKEIIYFSLGTLASGNLSLMRRFIDMFKEDLERLYVVSKGVKGDSIELDSCNMIGDNYIPQTLILQQANLAIIHAGNNTVAECLYHGIPMIVLPYFVDQFESAQRIDDLELGKRLDIHRCTKEEMFLVIEEVLYDKPMSDRLKEISRNMKSRDDLKRVSSILEKLANERQLDEDFLKKIRSEQ